MRDKVKMNPLRIAIVTLEYGYEGGAERFVWQVTERISRLPFIEVNLFAARWKETNPRIICHQVPILKIGRCATRLSFCWNAHQMVQNGKYDLVHCHDLVANCDVLTFGVPHLFWVKEIQKKNMLSPYNHLIQWLEKKTLYSKSLSWILPNSQRAKTAFAQYYSDLLSKVQVVSPGVEFDRFCQDRDRTEQREKILNRFGWHQSHLLGLFVGNNWKLKGLPQICLGIAEAKKRGLIINLLVVGRGDHEAMGSFLRAKGIANQVGFIGLVSEEIENFYKAADFFILLSRFESFGMVVLEAMASALPVILSADIGAWDVAIEGVNALKIVNAEDPQEIAMAYSKLSDPLVRKKMGHNARETAKKYDWSKVVEATLRIYSLVLKEKKLLQQSDRILKSVGLSLD